MLIIGIWANNIVIVQVGPKRSVAPLSLSLFSPRSQCHSRSDTHTHTQQKWVITIH